MFIVFDVGGTKTRIAASTDRKKISEPVIYSTPKSFDEGIEKFVATVKKMTNGERINAIAGGIAGPLDVKKSQLLNAPNIPNWNNKPLKQQLETQLQTRVFLENDTAMWGLGEALIGAGKGKKIVVYMTISTGVGGCRIVDGAIDASTYGFEPGHMIINPDGPECSCGGKGHLEAYAGGRALERRIGEKPEHIHDYLVWEDIAKYVTMGLLNVCVLWSPQIIILGGSMMKSISLQGIHSNIKKLNTILPELPEITLSTLQEKGGLIGSLAYIEKILL